MAFLEDGEETIASSNLNCPLAGNQSINKKGKDIVRCYYREDQSATVK